MPVKSICLPCTANVAELEKTAPTLFAATHLYSPLSVLFTFVILSCLLTADKLILSLAVTADPFLVQEYVGSGTPIASLEKVACDPCTSVWLCGCLVNSGWSVILIDSISVYLSSRLDTSPRPQETGFTWVTYVQCRNFWYKYINMNKETDRAPLISKNKHQYKIIMCSSIVQLFWFRIKEYWKVIKLEEHLTSPFFERQHSYGLTETILTRIGTV